MQSTSPVLLEVFRNTYFKTAQQKQSKFQKAGVLEYDGQDGAIHNLGRIKPFEMSAINSKNAASDSNTKTAWTTDNRQWYQPAQIPRWDSASDNSGKPDHRPVDNPQWHR